MSDHDGFFDEGPERAELVAGRYRLPHPETGTETSWTRATTHAELTEDSFALTRHQLRQLVLGLRQRPDLLRLVESWADEPNRAALDEVIASAHEAAGSDVKANNGTAIHGVLQQIDRAWNAELGAPDPAVVARLPEWAAPYVQGYLAELAHQGLTPISTMTERRVINLALGCAGTIDNLYAEADGTIVLGDKKTGRLDYPERKYAIQLAVYAGADYLLDSDGGPPIDLRSLGLRAEYAALIHIDPETGACSTYRADLRRGQYGANLAAEVREWRKSRGLLLPYVPPGVPAQAWQPAEERHLKAVPDRPSDNMPAFATEMQREQFDQRAQFDQHHGTTDPGTHAVFGGLANSELVQTFDDLMKLDKAALQGLLRELDPGATINHQRKILAQKILTLRSGGTVASSTPKVTGTDPAELPAGPATNGAEDPTDPRSQAFHRARLAEIVAAPTVGTLGRIHSFVLRVGGEQAWTDELTEAARQRVAELDAMTGPDPVAPGPPGVADRIRAAASSEEIANIWSDVTVGGSSPYRWTPELIELADARLREVTPPAPTANPYAPQ